MDIFRFVSPFEALVGVESPGTALPTGLAISTVYPQPASGGVATVEFTMPTNSQAELAVFDVSGRKVRTVLNATLEGGRHSAGFSTTGLATGTYFVKLNAGQGSVAVQLKIKN
jgi:hypothetical protein